MQEGLMRQIAGLTDVVRASGLVLAALILGGCAAQLAAVIMPNTEPGSDYHAGYMAGVSFAEDAWNQVGTAASWLDRQSLTATDVAIQKALMSLPPSIVENQSPVWVEAFRAGASGRFDQYRVFAQQQRDRRILIGVCTVLGVLTVAAIIAQATLARRLGVSTTDR
jgi:hypothetical protein